MLESSLKIVFMYASVSTTIYSQLMKRKISISKASLFKILIFRSLCAMLESSLKIVFMNAYA